MTLKRQARGQRVKDSFFMGNVGEYSCLENPRDGGAWWAAIYGVAQSQMTEMI